MIDDTMGPDKRGYILVYVGGKYGRWRRVENLADDTLRLEPIGPASAAPASNPDQLALSDDPNYETFKLGDTA